MCLKYPFIFSLFQFYLYKYIKLNDFLTEKAGTAVFTCSNACGIHNSPKPVICMGCIYVVQYDKTTYFRGYFDFYQLAGL
jgi:Zn-finger protein